MPENSVLLNKVYQQEKLVNESLTCWGYEHLTDVGERKYPSLFLQRVPGHSVSLERMYILRAIQGLPSGLSATRTLH